MSNTDEQQRERRKRRRRAQSAQTVPPEDPMNEHRYTKLLVNRLRKANLLDEEKKPMVAMQTRHVNNHQHAIPFRQQLLEQLVEDCQLIDRQIEADRRKQAEEKDKETGRWLRRTEAMHQKKVREMELLNHQGIVRQVLENYLENSTPKGQLRRIRQLEENYNNLRRDHDELVQRVNQNERKCDQNKYNVDQEIAAIRTRFSDYRKETNLYRDTTTKTLADLEEKLTRLGEKQELLDKKQREHGTSMEDLSLQQGTVNKLYQQIEQIINTLQSDFDKLDRFSERLDVINSLLNQVREELHPLGRISSLEREIEEIRGSLIDQSTVDELASRVNRALNDIDRHNDALEKCQGQLDTMDVFNRELKRIIDDITINNLPAIQSHLKLIDEDLVRKSLEIGQASSLARTAVDQINELRQSIASISKNLSTLEDRLRDIENLKPQIEAMKKELDALKLDPILERDNGIRDQRQNLDDIERQLSELAKDLKDLERKVDGLNEPPAPSNESKQGDRDDRHQIALEETLKEFIQQIRELMSNFTQQFTEQINETKAAINILRAKLDELLNAQSPTSSITVPNKPPTSKRVPYIEPLQAIDLLQNIWT